MFIGSVRLTNENPEIVVQICPHEMIVYSDSGQGGSGYILHAHDHRPCDQWRERRKAVFTFDRMEPEPLEDL